jgi:hypothetical protein
MGIAAFGIIFRGAVTVRAIDYMRGDEAVDKSRYNSDNNDTGQEETGQHICRGGWGEAGTREVVFRGGEHAIKRGKELPGVRPDG